MRWPTEPLMRGHEAIVETEAQESDALEAGHAPEPIETARPRRAAAKKAGAKKVAAKKAPAKPSATKPAAAKKTATKKAATKKAAPKKRARPRSQPVQL